MNLIVVAVFWAIAFIVLGKIYESRTGHKPEWKYFKPYSGTWWAAAWTALAGFIGASEPLHKMAEVAEAVGLATGGASPDFLLAGGLAGIAAVGRGG